MHQVIALNGKGEFVLIKEFTYRSMDKLRDLFIQT